MTTASLAIDIEAARRRLEHHVAQALWRMRMQEAVRSGVLALLVALCVLVPMVLLDKLLSLSQAGYPMQVAWLGVLGLCIPYVAWRMMSRRLHDQLAAALADDRLHLHARLCTAITLDPSEAPAFSEAFYNEAAERLEAFDPALAFPIKLPRLAYLLPLPAVLAGAVYFFMPEKDILQLVAAQQMKDRQDESRKDAAEKLKGKLEDITKRIDAEQIVEDSAQYKVNQLVKKAEDIEKQLHEGKRDPNEHVVAMAELKREIGEEKEKITEGKDFLSRLKEIEDKKLNLEESAMTKEVSESLKLGDAAGAARQMRKLAREMKDEILNNKDMTEEQKQAAMEKLQKEVERLADALQDQQALRDKLEDLSQSLSQDQLEQLQQNIQDFQEKQQQKNNQNGQQNQPDAAGQIDNKIEEVAQELERLEEENENDLSEDEQDALDSLDELEESLDEAMEGIVEGMGNCQGGDCQGGEQAGQQGGQQGGKDGGKQGGKQGGKKLAQGSRQDGKQGGKQGGNQNGNQNGNRNNGQIRPGNGNQGGGPGMGSRPYRDGDAEFEKTLSRSQMQSGFITGLSHFKGQGAKGESPKEYVSVLEAAAQYETDSLERERVPADSKEMVKQYFSRLKTSAGIDAKAPAPAPAAPPAPKKDATFDGTEPLKE